MDIQKLIDVLTQLRSESVQLGANPSESEIKALMRKYNTLFLGKKFNYINSLDLFKISKEFFNVKITNDEFNKLIPIACETLYMKFEPLVEINQWDSGSYSIELW